MEELQLDDPPGIGSEMLTRARRLLVLALVIAGSVLGAGCGGGRSDDGLSQSFLEDQEKRTSTLEVDPCQVPDREDIEAVIGGSRRRRRHQTLLWKTCSWHGDGAVLDVLVSPEGAVVEPSLRRGDKVDLRTARARAVYEEQPPLDREGRGVSVVVAVDGRFGMVGLSGPQADGPARSGLEAIARKLATDLERG